MKEAEIYYCFKCDHLVRSVFLPVDLAFKELQPAYYCLNPKCRFYGIITVKRKTVDQVSPSR